VDFGRTEAAAEKDGVAVSGCKNAERLDQETGGCLGS
jgi:hypothetical protein